MKFINKHWLIILFILITIIRFIISFNLPSFYINNLKYDDKLMINLLDSLLRGNYLGEYCSFTLIKGTIFPLLMYYSTILHLSYSSFFTLIYILSCIYFISSIKELINNKKVLLIIYILLLFNPITYSGELFQRLYVNTISITELLIFLGALINVITTEKNNIIYYIILGTISSIMLLTRNDNIWIYIILFILIIYKLFKNFNIKLLIKTLIPFLVIILGFNIVSIINYKYYNIYTYNELENSSFKDAYRKVQEIDNKKIRNVSITKKSFYILSKKSKVFGFTKKEIDNLYEQTTLNKDKEIDNGNIIWFFRIIIYSKYKFKDGKEANDYYKKLDKKLDNLYKNKELKRNRSIPSVFINIPTKEELLDLPKNYIKAIIYTTTYNNIRTYSKKELENMKKTEYNHKYKAYSIIIHDYRHAENMITKNISYIEIIRIIYMLLTILLSIPALIIYVKNIKEKNKLVYLNHIILLVYLIILSGVVYTHTTAFYAIRYRYLSSIYILQELFIIINIYIFLNNKILKKEDVKNDISSNTSIQRRKVNTKNNTRNKKSTKRKQTRKKVRNNSSK